MTSYVLVFTCRCVEWIPLLRGADALITKFPLNVVLELGICIVHKTCLACMRAKELGNMLLSNIS